MERLGIYQLNLLFRGEVELTPEQAFEVARRRKARIKREKEAFDVWTKRVQGIRQAARMEPIAAVSRAPRIERMSR